MEASGSRGSEGSQRGPGRLWAVEGGQAVATHHFQGHQLGSLWVGVVGPPSLAKPEDGICFPSFTKKKVDFFCFCFFCFLLFPSSPVCLQK